MRRNWKMIIGVPAVLAAAMLTAAMPTWAGPSGGFVPERPRPQPFIVCGPEVTPGSLLLVRHGQTSTVYPAKSRGLLTPAQRAHAVPCAYVPATVRITR